MAKYHSYGWYLSRTRISRISRIYFFVAATGILIWSQWKNSEGVEIREIREIRVGKINIQHYNKVYGFTKLHQAGVSPALFSGFRPGRGKISSDEMDSKMHPAL